MLGAWSKSGLFPDGRRDARFPSLFLHILEFLLGIVDGFLFSSDLFFALCVFLIPGSGVTETIARVSVKRRGAQAVLAIGDVKFAGEQIDLILLSVNFLLPVLIHLLLFYLLICLLAFLDFGLCGSLTIGSLCTLAGISGGCF